MTLQKENSDTLRVIKRDVRVSRMYLKVHELLQNLADEFALGEVDQLGSTRHLTWVSIRNKSQIGEEYSSSK